MKRVLTAVILIPLVVLAVLKSPAWLFAILAGAVAFLATREYLSILDGYGLKPLKLSVYALTTLLFASACSAALQSPFFHPSATQWFLPIFGLGSLLLLSMAMRQEDLGKAFLSAVTSAFALFYVSFPLLLIVDPLMPSDDLSSDGGRIPVLFLLVIVWVSDTFAYYVGRNLGRRLLAPAVSPKKTVEGAIGSMVGALLVAAFFWLGTSHVGEGKDFWSAGTYWISMAAVINIAAQLGDLVESMIKRGANIKDSGGILPGHGGVLDRIDALLFASPAMWYYPRIFHAVKDLLFSS